MRNRGKNFSWSYLGVGGDTGGCLKWQVWMTSRDKGKAIIWAQVMSQKKKEGIVTSLTSGRSHTAI